jgi:hypothetical protein
MASPIVIQVTLEPKDIAAAGQEIAKKLQNALDSSSTALRATGQKVGDALSAGVEAAARKLESQIQTIRERAAQARIADQLRANQKLEQDALKHNARLEAIATQAGGRIAQVEAKRQADLDLIRERFYQKEIERQRKLEQQAANNQGALAFFRRFSSTIREAGESVQQSGEGITRLLTRPILDLGRAAVQSAVNLDRQINVLKSLTGSAEEAERRFAQLVATAQKSPGLTTSLAATLDAQLRVANVTVSTIDKLLPAIGKLNAVSPLQDPQRFVGNLTQLITQGFERQDLKELVGQSPLAGELIKQIFGVDNPTNAKAIREAAKKAGIDTTEEFFAAFATAAAGNSKLAGVTESIGTQFEKLRDRVLVALRPLGLAIIEALQPLVEKAVPIIERLSKAFAELPQGTKQAIIVIAGLAAAIGPVLIAIGALVQAFGALGNIITVISGALGLGGIGGAAGLGALLASLAPIILPVVAALGALGAAWATNFGGIRDLTRDVITEVSAQFSELRRFWAEIAPDLLEIIKPVMAAIQVVFDTWATTVGAIYRGAWETVKTITREAADFIKPTIRALLALSRGEFDVFGQQIQRAWREAWDAIIVIPNRALLALYDVVVGGIRRLLDITGIAKVVGESLGTSLMNGIKDAITGLFPSTVALVRGVVSTAEQLRDSFLKRDTSRTGARNAIEGRGLDGEEITAGQLAASNVAQFTRIQEAKGKATKLGGGGDSAESKARQLREAQLRFTKETLEQQARLVEDANQRELKAVQERFDNERITLRQFYEDKTGLEQASIGNSINLIQSELRAAQEAFGQTKPNSVERIRLQTEINKLTTDLEIKTRALTDAETENQVKFLEAAKRKRDELLQTTQKLLLPLGQLPSDTIAPSLAPVQIEAQRRIREADQQRRQASLADLQVQQQELAIQQAITLGVISEAEGKEATLALQRQLRDVLVSSLEAQIETDPEKLARLNIEIQKLATLGQQLSPAQAFFKGLRSNAETTAGAFERIGASLKDKFLGVLDSGIDKLTQKFGLFKDLIGDILKSLTRKVIGQLFGLGSGGGGGFGSAPSGGGGFNIGGLLGGLFGGNQQQSGGGFNLANLFGASQQRAPFLTGGFAGGSGAAGILGGGGGFNLGSLFGGSGGASIPPSFSGNVFTGLGFPGTPGINPNGGGIAGLGNLSNLKNLFSGIGFGRTPGSGGALAGLLPLLGLSAGSQLGGGGIGSILGGVGGLALGIGATAAPAFLSAGIFASGGALGGLGSAATALFSNPFTAIAGAALLAGAFFIGRAKQRRKDEATSGDYLQQAVDNIRDLVSQVKSDQLQGAEAKKLFETEVMATFIAQVNTIKTKSVRESRLTNQTRDLRALFEKEVTPEIEAQKLRIKNGAFGGRVIKTEFATGGIVGGVDLGYDSINALLRPREMVLTVQQQRSIAEMTGISSIFQLAGVPGAGSVPLPTAAPQQAFAFGGIVAPSTARSSGDEGPMVINVYVKHGMGDDEAVAVVEGAGRTARGRGAVVKIIKTEKAGGSFR